MISEQRFSPKVGPHAGKLMIFCCCSNVVLAAIDVVVIVVAVVVNVFCC